MIYLTCKIIEFCSDTVYSIQPNGDEGNWSDGKKNLKSKRLNQTVYPFKIDSI